MHMHPVEIRWDLGIGTGWWSGIFPVEPVTLIWAQLERLPPSRPPTPTPPPPLSSLFSPGHSHVQVQTVPPLMPLGGRARAAVAGGVVAARVSFPSRPPCPLDFRIRSLQFLWVPPVAVLFFVVQAANLCSPNLMAQIVACKMIHHTIRSALQ
ncbi:hypothetical protein Taro_003523 [Colocasia esculenta]|uniref:Uncharacterized protein n=1 Tax=Colocasia esculenta TaxID=4460 RepID=A0A843TP01_COLES|nr:hypothetical protein [Colocasia esculenta]